ncbi:chalcone isomerase-like protein [Aquimarina sp. MAR_2010_214]|uniref:chalcone isomerase family protein n=1 Tax=Aquimarina sp. MAR_2010_214 TaxID=1250026 RepID=UPI000C708A58|nr:chalcone isomerase family protein [Aquimarina sp. MAR_2010_214]PKV50766.1 chalcone isomerase-like protein [Aquimarina sp. MAR_2010_214]
MKKITLVLVALISLTTATAQIRIGKAILPYEENFGDADLKLNGAGMRKVLWIDMYAGGLYLGKKNKDPKAILDANETMAIKLNIVSGFVTQKKMIKAVKDGFVKATFGNTKALNGRINKFINFFSEPIVKNDIFDLVYIKDKGVTAFKNGKKLGEIEGRDFKYALFKIWLGDEPASEEIKMGMLGLQ